MAFFDRSRSIAYPGFNRWLVPPAALCIHLCIGEAYAFSVFTKPMSQAIGVTAPTPGVDWTVPELGWIFSLAILALGLSAAFGGKWVERVGPRMAMFVAAVFFSIGLIVAGIGVNAHLLWLVYLGYGVIGGCGLGIGYISPVSTLIKWFPDRPGLATGTAIMGFGGGALIGAPLSVLLMRHFANATNTGVAQTMFVLGILYFIWMFVGSMIVRLPAEGWKPAGYAAPVQSQGMITAAQRASRGSAADAAVLSALARALLERHRRHRRARPSLAHDSGDVRRDGDRRGRLRRADEHLQYGRPNLLGFALGLYRPQDDICDLLYIGCFALLLGSDVGAFARAGLLRSIVPRHHQHVRRRLCDGSGVPTRSLWDGERRRHSRRVAYRMVGCRCRRPVLINYIRQYQIDHGVAKADAYSVTMYVMAALLVVGLLCDLAIRPVDKRHHLEAEIATT